MNRPPTRGAGAAERDRGSASLFFAVALLGLLALVGLVVDGGVKARAIGRADTLAAEAAWSSAQTLDVPTALRGGPPVVDPARARAAASAYLAAHGATGTVTILDGGRRVAVQVTLTRPTVFLGLIGIREVTAHGAATVTLTPGLTGAAL